MLNRRETGMSAIPLLVRIAPGSATTGEAYGSSDKGMWWQLISALEGQGFAYDIALLTHGVQDIRCRMEDLKAAREKGGLKMNVTTTKLMKVMTKQNGTVNIDQGTQSKKWNSETDGTCDNIRARISQGRHAFALPRPLWHTTSPSLKTKLRIFFSSVNSVLLYGSETWRLAATLINRCLSTNACGVFSALDGLRG